MLYIFLCEDSKKQREFIEVIINKIILFEDFELCLACSTDNPHTILEQMDDVSDSGIYFLDIDLHSDMNGLLLAQKIRQKDPRGFIVFITTHSEMSYMTFTYKVEALDFIIKDKPNELHARIHQCILDAYYKYKSPQNSIHKNFTCFSGEKEYCVPLENILFFETSLNAHKILLHEYDKTIEFTGKLTEIEKKLPDEFHRIHRSFLVNKKHIKEIDLKNRLVTMSNGEVCIASLNSLRRLKQK
ncbi:MAG: response regulator transcription factor [Lachnospiraceae bacterium]|nr:response regulator transcription factor [Lachnospiraceae bacterium]